MTPQYQHQDRSMEYNKEARIDPNTHGKMIFDKGTKAIQWRKYSFFKQMVVEQLDIHKPKKEL